MAWTDPELVKSARDHSPEAWGSLLEHHQLPLYTYIAEFIHDRTAALDIVQETFAAAVHQIPRGSRAHWGAEIIR